MCVLPPLPVPNDFSGPEAFEGIHCSQISKSVPAYQPLASNVKFSICLVDDHSTTTDVAFLFVVSAVFHVQTAPDGLPFVFGFVER